MFRVTQAVRSEGLSQGGHSISCAPHPLSCLQNARTARNPVSRALSSDEAPSSAAPGRAYRQDGLEKEQRREWQITRLRRAEPSPRGPSELKGTRFSRRLLGTTAKRRVLEGGRGGGALGIRHTWHCGFEIGNAGRGTVKWQSRTLPGSCSHGRAGAPEKMDAR